MFYKSCLPDIGGGPGKLLYGTVANHVLCNLSFVYIDWIFIFGYDGTRY